MEEGNPSTTPKQVSPVRHASGISASVKRALEMTDGLSMCGVHECTYDQVSGCDKCVRRHKTESELKADEKVKINKYEKFIFTR